MEEKTLELKLMARNVTKFEKKWAGKPVGIKKRWEKTLVLKNTAGKKVGIKKKVGEKVDLKICREKRWN